MVATMFFVFWLVFAVVVDGFDSVVYI